MALPPQPTAGMRGSSSSNTLATPVRSSTGPQTGLPPLQTVLPGGTTGLLTSSPTGTPATVSTTTSGQLSNVAQYATALTPAQQALLQLTLRGNTSMATQSTTPPASIPTAEETAQKMANLEQQTEQVAATAGTAATEVQPVLQTVQQNELLTPNVQALAVKPGVVADTIDQTQIGTIATPAKDPSIGQVSTTASAQQDVQNMAFQGATSNFSPNDLVDIAQIGNNTLSAGAMATAANQTLDQQATVQFQLSQLLTGLQPGQPAPPWASPAIRKASAIMQQRGLGSSSVAAAAITQAVMESGVTIAAQDAKAYQTIQIKNLDNQQQAALQNALQVATMDRQNADARTKGMISNAQALLSIDLKELDAQQQSNAIKYSAQTQAALSEANAENTRLQINAKNELQLEEFYTELGVQIDTANINRDVAIKQYNTNQANSFKEFNASMEDQRDKFNANMAFAIDQSNAQWRRQINTANTATLNETNRINTQNAFNASQTALNQLWQKYRDNATFNFTSAESEKQRKHEQALRAMEIAASESMLDSQQKSTIASNLIKVIANW